VTIVHLLRSDPDETTRMLIEGVSRNMESVEISLNRDVLDYDQLVRQIFDSGRVVCWW
jgi:hypothetical protein